MWSMQYVNADTLLWSGQVNLRVKGAHIPLLTWPVPKPFEYPELSEAL